MGATLPHAIRPTSRLGLGGAWLVAGLEEGRNRRMVEVALDSGITHFDTAPVYGLGTSEDVLGRALRRRRDQVTITTKAGLPRPAVRPHLLLAHALYQPLKGLVPRPPRRPPAGPPPPSSESRGVFDAAFIDASLNQSLKRLRTDHVDLFLLHEARAADITDELLGLLDRRRRSGDIRAIGIATTPRDQIGPILEAYRDVFDVVQYSWSLLDRNISAPGPCDFHITHGALSRAYPRLKQALAGSPAAAAALSAITGLDLGEDQILADVLLACALENNPGGVAIFATHRADRIRRLANFGGEALSAAARKLLEADLSEIGL